MLKIFSYLRLFRLHHPIGILLLFSPACWGILLSYHKNNFPSKIFLYFVIGAVFARAAGCTVNDMIDQDLDKKVERTKSRPLASGALSNKEALIGFCFCGLICLYILTKLPPISVYLSLFSIIPIIIYPFMKYVTYWPQLFLGFTFNLSHLIAISAVTGKLESKNLITYLGCVFWTLGYDTIYGHQDKKDDLISGAKSTSIKLDKNTKLFLAFSYFIFFSSVCSMAYLYNLKKIFYLLSILVLFHLIWQIVFLKIDDKINCHKKFISNLYLGLSLSLIIFISK